MVPSKNALSYFILEYDVKMGMVKVSYVTNGTSYTVFQGGRERINIQNCGKGTTNPNIFLDCFHSSGRPPYRLTWTRQIVSQIALSVNGLKYLHQHLPQPSVFF